MTVDRFINWAKERKRWLSKERCLWLYLTSSDYQRFAVVQNAESAAAEHVLAAEEREFRERLGDAVFIGPKGNATLRELIGQPAAGTA